MRHICGMNQIKKQSIIEVKKEKYHTVFDVVFSNYIISNKKSNEANSVAGRISINFHPSE